MNDKETANLLARIERRLIRIETVQILLAKHLGFDPRTRRHIDPELSEGFVEDDLK